MRFFVIFTLVIFSFITQIKAEISTDNQSFEDFLNDLKTELSAKGIDTKLLITALGQSPQVDKKVLDKLVKQPESRLTFEGYYKQMVSKHRVRYGLKYFAENSAELTKKEAKYKVPAEVIVALWGMESAYGKYTSGFKIIPSLATLAYASHRKKFFRKELIHALKIVQEGHIPLEKMTGSWAGAMGQCQFMPTSFFTYAADGDNDGQKDIWNNLSDVFASTANYVKTVGWNYNQPWGQQVVLGKVLPPIKIHKRGLSQYKTVAEWKKLGIYAKKGNLLEPKIKARLFIPNGPSGNAYLVYNNFGVIMKWNNSSYFAFAVLDLADKIAQGSKT